MSGRRKRALALGSVSVAILAGAVLQGCTSEEPVEEPAPSPGGWVVSVAAGAGELRSDAPAAQGGFADGPADSALFDHPVGMALAPDGSVLIADAGNHRIRRLTTVGTVETVAGSGGAGSEDGPVASATFRSPVDVAVAGDGTIYVVDSEAGQVRRIRNGVVQTVAGVDIAACVAAAQAAKGGGEPPAATCPQQGGSPYREGEGAQALFNQPTSVVLRPDGALLVADSGNQVIRQIDDAGLVSLFAGIPGRPGNADGHKEVATFFFPADMAFGRDGALYLTEGSRIRRIRTDGQVNTLAGSRQEGADAAGYADGVGTDARFKFASGLAIRADGTFYVSDTGNQRVREVKPGGEVSTAAGKGGQGFAEGPGATAQFSQPVGIVVLADGSLLVSDYNLNRIFRIVRPGP